MRRNTILVLALLAILALAGCGREQALEGEAYSAVAPQAARVDMGAEAPAMEEAAYDLAFDEELSFETEAAQAGQERLIIRSAEMGIVVTDTQEAMQTVSDMVSENGGWVVSSNVFQYYETAMTGNMSVRIPAAGFDSFLEAVSGLAVEVNRISTSGQDVTEEYVDLNARLGNLEATAERVRVLLDEARQVEDALEVSRELSRLEGEIESLKGRMQYLEQSSAFSAVNIDFTPDILAQPLEVGGWQPQGVARSAVEALIGALQALVDVAIWFIVFALPILLLVGVPVYLLVRYLRRRRADRKAAADNTAVEG